MSAQEIISFHNWLFVLNIMSVKFIHVDPCSFSYCHCCRVFHFIKIAPCIHPFSYVQFFSITNNAALKILSHVSL